MKDRRLKNIEPGTTYTSRTCSICGATETHSLIGWLKANWRYNPILNKFACSREKCRNKLLEVNHVKP